MHRLFAHAAVVAALAGAVATSGAQPRSGSETWTTIDNARVRVWADRGQTPPSGRLPTLRIALNGDVEFTAAGDVPRRSSASPAGGYVVSIELKPGRAPLRKNPSGFPLAFPRPGVVKVMENDLVVLWDYTWTPGVPTPMHFHDKDVVVVYLADGALRSTEPSGQSVINPHVFGFTKFNTGDRVHTEELTAGQARAIITELK